MVRMLLLLSMLSFAAVPVLAEEPLNQFFEYMQELNDPYRTPYYYNPCALSPCLPWRGEVFPAPEVNVYNNYDVYIYTQPAPESGSLMDSLKDLPDAYWGDYR